MDETISLRPYPGRGQGNGRPYAMCRQIPGLPTHLTTLQGEYSPHLLTLFGISADHGERMYRKRHTNHGLLSVIGDPAELGLAIGQDKRMDSAPVTNELIDRYGRDILGDPEKAYHFFVDLGQRKLDNATFFDPDGRLLGVARRLNCVNEDEIDPSEIALAMKLKGEQPGVEGNRHLAALWGTKKYASFRAVATSENQWHTTMAIAGGRVIRKLTYNPVTGLYGEVLVESIEEEEEWEI